MKWVQSKGMQSKTPPLVFSSELHREVDKLKQSVSDLSESAMEDLQHIRQHTDTRWIYLSLCFFFSIFFFFQIPGVCIYIIFIIFVFIFFFKERKGVLPSATTAKVVSKIIPITDIFLPFPVDKYISNIHIPHVHTCHIPMNTIMFTPRLPPSMPTPT